MVPDRVHMLGITKEEGWMKSLTIILILGLPLVSTGQEEVDQIRHYLPASEKLLTTIAFGSCNIEHKPQEMWRWIAANKPDLWIWLGDIIYGDTRDMAVLSSKYAHRKNHPVYQMFIQQHPSIGIWDDHDYGENDAGGSYPMKKPSRDLLFEFLDLPADDPAWRHEGAYQSYLVGPSGRKVKIVLLDVRYFRGEPGSSDHECKDVPETDILGQGQWEWLERELCNSPADLHIIGSGIQILADEHRFEKWADFPQARQRLYDLLIKCDPKRVVFLSGDRHMAEVSAMALDDFGHLLECTSSGMTHTRQHSDSGLNRFRIGDAVNEKNFALLHLIWDENPLKIAFEIRGLENVLFQRVDIRFPD